MLNKILKGIKQYYRKDRDIYYGDLLVSKLDKRVFSNCDQGYKIDFRNLLYRDDLKGIVIDLKNVPYLDDEYPTMLRMNKKNQIIDIIYIRDGIGSLSRNNRELPSHMKFEIGKVIEEEYASNRQSMKYSQGYSSYTIPNKVIYQNGIINQEESNWDILHDLDEKGKKTTMKHCEYKEIIKCINIDINNFKDFTLYERMVINMYMTPENYAMKLKEFDIEPTKEGIKNNLKLLEMIYI